MSNKAPLIGVALGGFLLIGILSTTTNTGKQGAKMIKDWINTLLRKTSEHEGTYTSVQQNKDGQGVSYGILQWTQRGGGLGKVLTSMRLADARAFDKAFDGQGAKVVAHTTQADEGARMAPLDGANLWDEPWLKRFIAAGKVKTLQDAQAREGATSEYMRAAVKIARILGVHSERAMVLFYNRTVHQGPSTPVRAAEDLAEHYRTTGRPSSERTILAQYAWQCGRSFRLTNAPASETRPNGGKWVRHDSERQLNEHGALVQVPGPVWHAHTGPWDLYDLIAKRSADILADSSLRDTDVDLTAV